MKTIVIGLLILLSATDVQAQWTEFSGPNSMAAFGLNCLQVRTICSDPAGNIYTAGQVGNSSGNICVAKFNGNGWSELGGLNSLGNSAEIYSMCTDSAGNIYAGGRFGSPVEYTVAVFDGNNWTELGGANSQPMPDWVYCILSDDQGNIYASGGFTNNSGKFYVARWNGSSWSELGGNNALAANGEIMTLCKDPSGNIYAAGYFKNNNGKFYVAKWDGSSWSELGGNNGLTAHSGINTICSDASGNIYAGGRFTDGINESSGNKYVARWNGSSWAKLGDGTNALAGNSFINSIAADAAGNIYAAGDFYLSGIPGFKRYVAIWDGSSWTELGGTNSLSASSSINALFFHPNGRLLTGGAFINGNNRAYIAEYVNPSAVNSEVKSEFLRIFPNPFSKNFILNADASMLGSEFFIYNAAGQMVYEGRISELQMQLKTEHLSRGLYLLKSTGQKEVFVRLVKE